MYNPPSKINWVHVGSFLESYKEYYDIGYNASKDNKEYEEPFEPSKHERDTSYTDELNFWYYCGYYDWEESEISGDFS